MKSHVRSFFVQKQKLRFFVSTVLWGKGRHKFNMKSSLVKAFTRTVFWSSPRPRKTILNVGFFFVVLLLFSVGFSSSFSSSSSPFQIAIQNGNFNRKLLQYSRVGAPKRNGGESYYSYNEDEGVPLNSNPSIGSNTMSNIEDFDDYDKSAYYSYEEENDNNNNAEREEDLGGGEGEVETVVEEEEEEESPSVSSVLGGATARSGEMDVSSSLLSRSRSAAENDDDDGYVTLRDGSRKQTAFWYKAAKKIGKNEHVRRFGQQSAKFGMRVARSKPVQSTGRGFMNSHRKAKDTLKRTKLMRDASDRQVNQAMLGIMVVILACWMLFGMFVVVPARERRQREWAEKVES
mgnify:FL=1